MRSSATSSVLPGPVCDSPETGPILAAIFLLGQAGCEFILDNWDIPEYHRSR
jgi:hypothetical protein